MITKENVSDKQTISTRYSEIDLNWILIWFVYLI